MEQLIPVVNYHYFDRDISWLSFNERVLLEAAKETVPLLERINFLSIYSSNLDEFYRVRIPVLMALQKIKKDKSKDDAELLKLATGKIETQLKLFGSILTDQLIPRLRENSIHRSMPNRFRPSSNSLHGNSFTLNCSFCYPSNYQSTMQRFSPSNQLYIAAIVEQEDEQRAVIINIPTPYVSRFLNIESSGINYVVFIDDIIKENLSFIYPDSIIKGAYSFKITRDAELGLQDEYEGDIAEKIEKQIVKRDQGFATRFLYSPGLPGHILEQLIELFNLSNATVVEGGAYHNLKDLSSFPVKDQDLRYPKWPALPKTLINEQSLLHSIALNDIVVHPPYHDYNLVLRFFNEAAVDKYVREIYVTLYRVAGDSHIASALITAARNGKTVTVFELKAGLMKRIISDGQKDERSGCQDHL
jgi:polyphosphate kinase